MASKPFNFGDAPLVRDTERTVENGYEAIEQKEQGLNDAADQPVAPAAQQQAEQKEQGGTSQMQQEPTKGVQTYIPMSMYRRLNDIKLNRRENIGNLVEEALAFWLDVQEGKKKVSETT